MYELDIYLPIQSNAPLHFRSASAIVYVLFVVGFIICILQNQLGNYLVFTQSARAENIESGKNTLSGQKLFLPLRISCFIIISLSEIQKF